MMEDKYIGLLLAVSGTLLIGTSFIVTKLGLNDAGRNRYGDDGGHSASDNFTYLKNPIWWAGMVIMVLGEAMNFAAYTFAPPILVTPLGAFSVLIGAVLASFLLGEELGHLGRVGSTLCLLGALIIVLHAPEDKQVETVDEVLRYALQPGFMMYCFTVLVICLVLVYSVAPKYGRTNPMVYLSIASLAGSVSIMAIKGFGVALKLTIGGHNQFTHPSTYVFLIVVVGCILVQMNYFNKALDTFSTNVVNPLYFVGFTTSTIVASLILFQGFNTQNATNTISCLVGFIITFLGVHLLTVSRKPELPRGGDNHSALETGLMNPRMSLQGRASLDWDGGLGHGVPRTPIHGRRSSLYRNQGTTIFNAFEGDDAYEGHELRGVREEDTESESEGEGVTERTHLRSGSRGGGRGGSGTSSPRHGHPRSPSNGISLPLDGTRSPR
jgi:drug/metabolite transporter (DMT)-like permease